MRTERNKDGTWTVWLSRDEYREIPRQARNARQEIALRLMGDCGLRVGEVSDVALEHVTRRSDGRHYSLEVVSGKDTTGEYDGGKYRETWLPRDLEARINQFAQSDVVDESASLVDRSKRTIQEWVENASARAAEETGDEDFRRVSTHDLRRSWAHYLLVGENVSPRIVMALGGWSSYDAIEPYLAAPTESNVTESMASVDL
jgi:integrase